MVIFIGFTGSGKTSLISYLNRETLEGKENDEGNVILENKTAGSKLKIGNSLRSETNLPSYSDTKEQVFVDLPGLLDNRETVQEFKNLYTINKIFKKSTKTKVVLVIEASSFQEARGNHVSELFRLVDFMFSNKDLLSKSLSVVVINAIKIKPKPIFATL